MFIALEQVTEEVTEMTLDDKVKPQVTTNTVSYQLCYAQT